MKGIFKIISIFLIISITLSGCKIPEEKMQEKLLNAKHWLNYNDFVITKETDFNKIYFKDLKKPSIGSVLSEYVYSFPYEKNDRFKPIITTIGQAEMLNLLIESYKYFNDIKYLNKAILIGNDLVNNIFKTQINNKEIYFIISKKYYNRRLNEWENLEGITYTKDQLKTAYSLLKLYHITKEKKYLDNALKLIDSQLKIAKIFNNTKMSNTLPYSYIKNNEKNYIIIEIFPLSLSKSIYETYNLAYKITRDQKYLNFANKNGEWLITHINHATINKDSKNKKVFYSAFRKINDNRYELVNLQNDSFSKDFDFNTQEMLETLIGLSYHDINKARSYKATVYKMQDNEGPMFNKVTKHADKSFNILKNKEYTFDVLSTILFVEYLMNVEKNKDKIKDAILSALYLMHNYKTNNTKGALQRYYHLNIIDVETTCYFHNVLLKYYSN